MERCRKLSDKYLDWSPESFYAWTKYVELETYLEETERARDIFELGIAQPALGVPELVWKMPKKLKKRRQSITGDGPAGYEEYIDYLFPGEMQTTKVKILEAAYKWKRHKTSEEDD